jgi:hypothetical protein
MGKLVDHDHVGAATQDSSPPVTAPPTPELVHSLMAKLALG